MDNKDFITIHELSDILGISRVAVFKRVKKGEIKAKMVGKIYLIPRDQADKIIGKTLGDEDKRQIAIAVKRTVKEYGEVLKMLGRE